MKGLKRFFKALVVLGAFGDVGRHADVLHRQPDRRAGRRPAAHEQRAGAAARAVRPALRSLGAHGDSARD